MKSDYKDKISETLKKLSAIDKERKEKDEAFKKHCKYCDTADVMCRDNTLTKELIDRLIDKIIVYKDKRIGILFKFKDELVSSKESAL